MRIELLDPKWKDHRNVLETRKAQASELLRGANVVSSLKNLARTRVDIFGAEADEERRVYYCIKFRKSTFFTTQASIAFTSKEHKPLVGFVDEHINVPPWIYA